MPSPFFIEADRLSGNQFLSRYRSGIRNYYSELRKQYSKPYGDYSELKNSMETSDMKIADRRILGDILKRSEEISGTELPAKTNMLFRDYSVPSLTRDADITLDGKSDEWKNVESVDENPASNRPVKIKGTVLSRIGAAVDSEYLYLMLETKDREYNSGYRYTLELSNIDMLRIYYDPGGQ